MDRDLKKVVILLAHPNMKESQANKALVDAVKDIEEADDSQNQSYSGERAAGTTTDDEVRQYSHQRAKHECGFWKDKQHDGNCQSAYGLRMV